MGTGAGVGVAGLAVVEFDLDLVVIVGGMEAKLAADTGVVGVGGAAEPAPVGVAGILETPVIPDMLIQGIITGTPWGIPVTPAFELPSTMAGTGKKGN